METLINPEPSDLLEEISTTNSLTGICSNCENNIFCTWIENKKKYCEEYK